MVCYMRYLPDPIGVYHSITAHKPNLATYVGPVKVEEVKSLDIVFFIHSNKQNIGVLS